MADPHRASIVLQGHKASLPCRGRTTLTPIQRLNPQDEIQAAGIQPPNRSESAPGPAATIAQPLTLRASDLRVIDPDTNGNLPAPARGSHHG